MLITPQQIQADFDRIAQFSDDGWNHNSHYHAFLLKHLPSPCRHALDIGCGTGAFSRLLAERSEHVLGLDLSPRMVEQARTRSTPYPNLDFQMADVMDWEFPTDHFDCIVSLATFHHLPFEAIVTKVISALKVNGVLLILDLFQAEGLLEHVISAISVPVSPLLRLLYMQRLREPAEVRRVWSEHGQHESYLTLRQIRDVCARLLPGARVGPHVLWRYSLVWKKEETYVNRFSH